MKSQMLSMVLALGAVAALGNTLEAQTYQMVANVPFAFHAGDRAFDAGKYMVGKMGALETPVLRGANGKMVFLSGSPARVAGHSATKMVFRRYSDGEYFLAQIWSGNSIGVAFSESKAERLVKQGSHEVAMVAVDGQLGD